MAAPTGIDAQLGFKAESVYGTPVVVDRWYEFNTEDLSMEIERLESAGVRSGKRVQRSDRWGAGRKTVGGGVDVELTTKNMGLLLQHCLGTVSTGAAVTGATPHTFTPGDLTALSLTGQVGRPDVGGTVRPFTYHGLKVASWELTGAVGEIGLLHIDFVGEDEDTSTGLATASYPASLALLTYIHGTLTIAGSAVSVRKVSLKGDNGLKSDRHFLGSQLIKNPLEASLREYGGTLEADFESLTAYTRFTAGTEAALVFSFVHPTAIGGSEFPTLTATCNVRFDGDTPSVDGPDIVEQTLPFKCLDSGAGASSAISVLYKTADATP